MNKIEVTNILKQFIDTYKTCHREEDTIAVSLNSEDVEAFSTAVKELEKETVSRESYDHEYFLRKELEVEIEKLKRSRKWTFSKTIFDKHGCTVECPSCHKKWKTYDEIRWRKENNYCPNCGSRNDK